MSKGNRNRNKRKGRKTNAKKYRSDSSDSQKRLSDQEDGLVRNYDFQDDSDEIVMDISEMGNDEEIETFSDFSVTATADAKESGQNVSSDKGGFFSFFRNRNSSVLKRLSKRADDIMSLESRYSAMSDKDLSSRTVFLKERIESGEDLDEILNDAYAVAREAAWRVLKLKAFKVQIMGAIVLHEGDIAEMKTGEGKTLTSIMPAYLNALSGEGVHIVTVNEYLAERDATDNGKVFSFLGISTGLNRSGLSVEDKRKAYACDITYTTNSELGFDYLRDNMVYSKDDKVQRGLHYAIIDEVDSILIDEARTPLIISGGKQNTASLYKEADRFAKSLSEERDFTVDAESRTVSLTSSGIDKAERHFSLSNLYAAENSSLLHYISQALKANYAMQADVDYMVATEDGSKSRENASIFIIDEYTGRILQNRQYNDGLHQAIEAKENVPIREETSTLATITYQNFFRLYERISGMTGTAKTEEDEFKEIYNMRVVEIPPNVPSIREDLPDRMYKTKEMKYKAICDEIERRHAYGQPILLGTISVETSEILSRMLRKRNIRHNVLNAKNHAYEARIIANAGVRGAVTIATNMAGRGTDIKLGEGVAEIGGLAVIGSERHESRRIDNQLRGRSGRQGDPGCSLFFLSLEDDLMTRFSNDNVQKMGNRFMGDQPLETRSIMSAVRNTQKRVENNNFESRKNVVKYDNVVSQQRELIYKERDTILCADDLEPAMLNMFQTAISDDISKLSKETSDKSEFIAKLCSYVSENYVLKARISIGYDEYSRSRISDDKLSYALARCALDCYRSRLNPDLTHERRMEYERYVFLSVLDRIWITHIDSMEKLRNGISLRAYAQRDPLNEYTQMGYEMFMEATTEMAKEISTTISRMGVKPGSALERNIPWIARKISFSRFHE